MGRRDDICDAALSIISEGGIRVLTLPVLFKRAQTGAGTFYHHFRDREDLIDAVYERCYQVAKEQLEGVDDPAAPPRERFYVLCRHMFWAACAAHPGRPRRTPFGGSSAPHPPGDPPVPHEPGCPRRMPPPEAPALPPPEVRPRPHPASPPGAGWRISPDLR